MFLATHLTWILFGLVVILFGAPMFLRWLRSGGGDDVESRISITIQDAKGQTFHIKDIPPGTVLDVGYARKLDSYLTRLAKMCSSDGLTFTRAAIFKLAPGIAVTPEFQALLIKHGLSTEANVMYD